MQAIIYCRQSQKKSVNSGKKEISTELSLESQERLCRKYCENNKISVLEVIYERGSARDIKNLPNLMKIVKKKEFNILLVADVSRLIRNMRDGLNLSKTLSDRGIRIYSVYDDCNYYTGADFIEKFKFRDLLNHAEFESDQIAYRVNRSLDHRRSIGAYIGNPSFGYECYKDSKGVRKCRINEAEKKIYNDIHSLAENMTYMEIAEKLNEHKVAYRGNKEWTGNRVKYVYDLDLDLETVEEREIDIENNKVIECLPDRISEFYEKTDPDYLCLRSGKKIMKRKREEKEEVVRVTKKRKTETVNVYL